MVLQILLLLSPPAVVLAADWWLWRTGRRTISTVMTEAPGIVAMLVGLVYGFCLGHWYG